MNLLAHTPTDPLGRPDLVDVDARDPGVRADRDPGVRADRLLQDRFARPEQDRFARPLTDAGSACRVGRARALRGGRRVRPPGRVARRSARGRAHGRGLSRTGRARTGECEEDRPVRTQHPLQDTTARRGGQSLKPSRSPRSKNVGGDLPTPEYHQLRPHVRRCARPKTPHLPGFPRTHFHSRASTVAGSPSFPFTEPPV